VRRFILECWNKGFIINHLETRNKKITFKLNIPLITKKYQRQTPETGSAVPCNLVIPPLADELKF
jgi:hypothetical protein